MCWRLWRPHFDRIVEPARNANKPILPIYPKLAGQNAKYALQQMKDIKSGKRNNGKSKAMKGVMHLVTEEEMKAIAKWLETLK